MDADQVADMFGIAALLAAALVAGAAVASCHPGTRERLRGYVDRYGAVSAWSVSLVATGGSLWFSEAAGFPPCELCWYQRIAMYPLVVVLGFRAFGRDASGLRPSALVLVASGLVVNAWHVGIETFPGLDSGSCAAEVPCTLRWVEGLGVFTIPRLASVAFLLIASIVLFDRTDRRPSPAFSDRSPR